MKPAFQTNSKLKFRRYYTRAGSNPLDEIKWKKVDVKVVNHKTNEVVFEQKAVECPDFWSDQAIKIVAQKYFYGSLDPSSRGHPDERETSVQQLVTRIVKNYRFWAEKTQLFASAEDYQIFEDELTYIIVHQLGCFNSPVWFNVGLYNQDQWGRPKITGKKLVGASNQIYRFNPKTGTAEPATYFYEYPQSSACYILSVKDDMGSILQHYVDEGKIFYGGSGVGLNLSSLRSSFEPVSGGGKASGPVSFDRGWDKNAGTIRSGGKCYRRGTLVQVPKGYVPIESLQVNDWVLTHSGQRRVLDFMSNGVKPIYRLVTKEGYTLDVTSGHKIAKFDYQKGIYVKVSLEQLVSGDKVCFVIAKSEGGHPSVFAAGGFNSHDTHFHYPLTYSPELGYVLGLQFGDGCIDPLKIRVSLSTSQEDQEISRQYSNFIGMLFGKGVRPLPGDGDCVVETVFSKAIVSWFVTNKLSKGKAGSLGLPHGMMCAPISVRVAFLEGALDSDGHFADRGKFYWSSIDREYLGKLQLLLASLGLPSGITLSRPSKGTWKALYKLTCVGIFAERFASMCTFSIKARSCLLDSKHKRGWSYSPCLYQICKDKDGGWSEGITLLSGSTKTTGYASLLLSSPRTSDGRSWRDAVCSHVQLEVDRIEDLKVQDETYDIQVDEDELLIANGIYASNTRRAARMVIMDVHHPDIFEFVKAKKRQEELAKILINEHGYDDSMDGFVLGETLSFQNSNHTVSVDELFVRAVREDGTYQTRWVTNPKRVQHTFKARDLYREMVESIWSQGEPAFQFTHTINKWNTIPNTGRIRASNPCSEFLSVDDTACNLLSINLLPFWDGETFDYERLEHVCRILTVCGDLNIEYSGFPSLHIAENTFRLRSIGLGHGNIHALVKCMGIPYDSDRARALCGLVTSIMTSTAFLTSAELSQALAPFPEYTKNREPFLKVMSMHRQEATLLEEEVDQAFDTEDVLFSGMEEMALRQSLLWDKVLEEGGCHGFRNSQVSLLAPQGTIGFFMDLDSFGIEPEFGTVVYKQLAGGGSLKLVSKTTRRALEYLGYSQESIDRIMEHVNKHDTVEGAPDLKEEDLPVFDCAVKCGTQGQRFISARAHITMMAVAQRFLSGAISKTVNLPEQATIEDIWDLFLLAEELGVKCFTVYRDGSRRLSPLSTSKSGKKKIEEPGDPPIRARMPDRSLTIRQKFRIGEQKGFIHIGFYRSGRIGEVFLTMNKEGDTVSGFCGVFAKMMSNMLQCGHTLEDMLTHLGHTKFDPYGFTGLPEVKYADSPVDLVVQYAKTVQDRVNDVGIMKFLMEHMSTDTELLVSDNPENREQLGVTKKGYRLYKKCPQCSNPDLTDPTGCPKCSSCGWSGGCGGG